MKHKAIWIMTALLLMLSGCAFYSGDDLLTAPKPSEKYVAIQNEMTAILKTGAVYATPQSGENCNNIQIVDLDNDGEDEVISFFRQAAGSSDFNVYLHKKIGDKYVRMGMITGHGTAVQKVDYPMLTPEGMRGIVISWKQAGASKSTLSLCVFENGALNSLLDTEYNSYMLFDLTDDGATDVFTLNMDGSGNKSGRLYSFKDQKMIRLGEAAVSREALSMVRLTKGYCVSGQPAIFAEFRTEMGTGLMTDVFVYHEKQVRNLALSTEQSTECSTYRAMTIYATDINSDGVTEVPASALMAGYEEGTPDALYILDWYSFDVGGKVSRVCSTYHNVADEWRLILPDGWRERVTAVKKVNSAGNSYSVFYEYRPGQENVELLQIYAFTGDMAEYLANREGMIFLGKTDTQYYAASIPASAAQSGLAMTKDELEKHFGILTSSRWNG